MTLDEAMGFSAAFRCRLNDTRYIFDEISAGLATKVEYQKHIEMRNHWEELVATLESEDIFDIDFNEIEKELNESFEFEKMQKQQEQLPPEEPTQLDRIEAQTMYTALMTDTLIEEG